MFALFRSSKKLTHPILVLGMHRSGTSMMMRLCNLLGVETGEGLVEEREDNEKGFWEHEQIVRLNEQVFEIFHLNSQDVIPLPEGWLKHREVQKIKVELIHLLRREFKGVEPWGLKDPRISRLLPMWLEIFAANKLNPHFIIPFRHPEEVTASLMKRDFISEERGGLLWLQYNLEIEKYSRNHKRVFVGFEEIYQHPKVVMERVSKELRFTFPHSYDSKEKEIAEFIDPGLRHHQTQKNSTFHISYLMERLYFYMQQMAKGKTIKARALDLLSQDLKSILYPVAESVWAMEGPTDNWRHAANSKQREIDILRKQLARLTKKTNKEQSHL